MNEKNNSICCCNFDKAGSVTCCEEAAMAKQKSLRIEYLYLDLDTCDRCIGTDAVLDAVVNKLSPALSLAGYDVEYEKVEIKTPELAAQYHFLSSPTILVNGTDIFGEVKESDCMCCGEIAGTNIDCRVFQANDENYEIPTEEMLADAILKSLSAGHTHKKDPYVLPENLRQFFEGRKEILNTPSHTLEK